MGYVSRALRKGAGGTGISPIPLYVLKILDMWVTGGFTPVRALQLHRLLLLRWEIAMSDVRDADSPDESEFGLGSGLIDPVQRAGRHLSAEDELREIYARPKTFDGSMKDRPNLADTPVPRLLPGETEEDRG